jgi:hypothetical protein
VSIKYSTLNESAGEWSDRLLGGESQDDVAILLL